MVCSGGYTDKIQVLEETAFGDGGAAGEKVFGHTKGFSWNIDTSSKVTYSLESDGPQGVAMTDGVLVVTGSHTFELTDGREFKAILGSVTAATNNFTLDVTGALPSYSVKAVDEAGDSKFIIIKGIKYTKFTLSLTKDETVQVTADWLGKTIENTTTFTPTVSTVEPLTYLDGHFAIASTALNGLDSVSITIDRRCVARRFIEQTSAGSRRLISKIVEGPLSVTFDGEGAAQRDLLEEIFGSTTLADVRTGKNMSLHLARGATAFNLFMTGARFTSEDRSYDKESEIATIGIAGIALDISGSGSYPSA